MLPVQVIFRTFQIAGSVRSGSAFAIDHNDKQYLITARHVVENVTTDDEIHIWHDDQWNKVNVKVVGIGDGKIDVAVLRLPHLLAVNLSLEASAHHIMLGQQVYFTGFPFDREWKMMPFVDQPFPAPFTKAGIFSGFLEDSSLLLIDGHNNTGFSGGPVVFTPYGEPPSSCRVAGIVSYYPAHLEPIVNENDEIVTNEKGNPFGYFKENSGFLIAVNVSKAIDIIETNPIGMPVPPNPT